MSHYNYMSSSTSTVDMSSYVAVTGKPETNFSCVFGLTPQELGYLKVGKIIGISDHSSEFLNFHVKFFSLENLNKYLYKIAKFSLTNGNL